MRIPPPKDGEEFDTIVLSTLRTLWNSPNLVRNGRRGQGQEGVDIYGEDNLGRFVGVQCKNVVKFDIDDVKASVTEAEKFVPAITALFFAFSLPNDAPLQREIRLLSAERIKEGKFAVGQFFWEDIFGELVKNPEELKKHYPDLEIASGSRRPSRSTALAALDLAYRGTCLRELAQYVLGEWGQFAGTDPKQALFLFQEIEEACTHVFESKKAEQMVKDCSEAQKYLLEKIAGKHPNDNWEPMDERLQRITMGISVTPYGLQPFELAAYSLGALLSKWYVSETDVSKIPLSMKTAMEQYLTALHVDEQGMRDYKAAIKKFEKNHSISSETTAAHAIYNLARRAILAQTVSL